MIKPEEYQTLAEIWITSGSEAEWRSAVSRAYYAAFHAARQLLVALGFRVPRASQAHAYLWMRLSNCGDPVIQIAGADLNNLQSGRNEADYDFHLSFTQATALRLVQLARLIIQRLATGLVEPTRTQIRDAMRDYERVTLQNVTRQGP
jgi:uncharacterized protein (UPF0332 family)